MSGEMTYVEIKRNLTDESMNYFNLGDSIFNIPDDFTPYTKLKKLMLTNNMLRKLPKLPPCLEELYVDCNKITNIKKLPQLKILDLGGNKNINIQMLPDSLLDLNVSFTNTKCLKYIPPFLQVLKVNNNVGLQLNYLPAGLICLDCSDCGLTELPELPPKLEKLFSKKNKLTKLPLLPKSLLHLNINRCCVTVLKIQPGSVLRILKCNYNPINLTGLEKLTNLVKLKCSNSELKILPEIVGLTKLKTIKLVDNKLKYLPRLPNSIKYINVDYNLLTKLPFLPEGLKYLECIGNQIDAPENMPLTVVYLHSNFISRQDYWHKVFKFKYFYYQLKFGWRILKKFIQIRNKKINLEIIYSPELKNYKKLADPITLTGMGK